MDEEEDFLTEVIYDDDYLISKQRFNPPKHMRSLHEVAYLHQETVTKTLQSAKHELHEMSNPRRIKVVSSDRLNICSHFINILPILSPCMQRDGN